MRNKAQELKQNEMYIYIQCRLHDESLYIPLYKLPWRTCISVVVIFPIYVNLTA